MKTAFNPSDGSFGPLSSYINPYLAHVKAQGFAVGSFKEQLHVLKLGGAQKQLEQLDQVCCNKRHEKCRFGGTCRLEVHDIG